MQDQDKINAREAEGVARPSPMSRKGTPPERHDVPGALSTPSAREEGKKAGKKRAKAKPASTASKKRSKSLRFHVTADARKAFKRAAAAQGCKKDEMFERLLSAWTDRHPG